MEKTKDGFTGVETPAAERHGQGEADLALKVLGITSTRGGPLERALDAAEVIARIDSCGVDVVDLSTIGVVVTEATRCALNDVLHLQERGFDGPTIICDTGLVTDLSIEHLEVRPFRLIPAPLEVAELRATVDDALLRAEELREAELERARMEAALLELGPESSAVLTAILRGDTNKLMAHDLGVSVRTVENRRRQIMKVLKCDSVAMLVRKVMPLWGSRGGVAAASMR